MLALGRKLLVPVTRALLGSAAERGLCRAELLAAAGISEDDLAVTDSWISIERHVRLGAAIEARLPGENLGLQTGERIYHDPAGAFGYVLRRSGTHAVALANFGAYLGLVNHALHAELQLAATEGCFQVQMQPELAALGHPAEALLSAWVAISRHLTARDWAPSGVQFEHEAKGDVREHEAFFRCPVEFGQGPTCLQIPAGALGLEIEPTSHEIDAALARSLEDAREKLGIADLQTELDALADRLRTPPRSVRAPGSPGARTSGIVLDVARGLFEHSRLCAYEVAFLVGFQDLAVFQQAYSDRFGLRPLPRG